MKIVIKLMFLIIFSYKANAKVLISPVGLSEEDYQKQILESYSLTSFTEHYLESPLNTASQKNIRMYFAEANNLYQSGDFNDAVKKLKKVVSYKYSEDWTPNYRKMIADAAQKLAVMEPNKAIKWKKVYKQFSNQNETIFIDLSHIDTESQFLINGIPQDGTKVTVDRNLKFRLSIINNKHLPFSVITDAEGLKSISYIKKPFLNNTCVLMTNSYLQNENIKIAYHSSCKLSEKDKFKELFSDDTVKPFNKYKLTKKKSNKWLLIGAGLLVGAIAYSQKDTDTYHSKGF